MKSSSLVAGLFALAFAACAVFLALRLNVAADMHVFFPKEAGEKERLLAQELQNGSAARLILVGIEGAPAEVLARTNQALAERLAADRRFSHVSNGAKGLTDAEQARLFAVRYLLSPAVSVERFKPDALREALQQQVQRLASPAPFAGKQRLPSDPTDEFANVLAAWRGNGAVKRSYQVFFSEDETRSLLVVAAGAAASDLDGQEAAIGALRSAFAAVAPAEVRLRLAGAPVIAVEARDAIQRDSTWLSVLATLAAAAFMFLVFRSGRPVLLCALPPLFGTVAATTVVTAAYGAVHGVTLAFGCTLIGTAIDYPMHFFSHLTRRGVSASVQFRDIWPTLRLGVTTTVVAFAMLMFSDHRGLAELGLFSVAGVVAAAMTTRWLLPALIPSGFAVSPGSGVLHLLLAGFARHAPGARLLLFAAVAAAVTVLVTRADNIWERDLAKLNPLSDARKRDEAILRADVGAPAAGKLLVVVAPSADAALSAAERLAARLDALVAQSELAGYDVAARYLPSAATQRARQAALPGPANLRANLAQAGRGLPFKTAVFEPFLRDVERTRTLPVVQAEELLAGTLGPRLAPLLFKLEGNWVAPVLLQDVRRPEAIAGLAGEEAGARVVYLDTKAEATRLMMDYRDAALGLIAWGTLIMFAILLASLRSWRRALAVLFVPVASVVTACGILVASGIGLTLFHLVSLLLVVGFGIDYALYFDRLEDHVDEWGTTFAALWRSWLTTAGAFAVLVLSSSPPLQAIGLTVSVGVTLCLVFGAASRTRRPHAPSRPAFR